MRMAWAAVSLSKLYDRANLYTPSSLSLAFPLLQSKERSERDPLIQGERANERDFYAPSSCLELTHAQFNGPANDHGRRLGSIGGHRAQTKRPAKPPFARSNEAS